MVIEGYKIANWGGHLGLKIIYASGHLGLKAKNWGDHSRLKVKNLGGHFRTESPFKIQPEFHLNIHIVNRLYDFKICKKLI